MRHLPKFNYCGVTIVLSYPSRFDTDGLCSGAAHYIINDGLGPNYNRYHCDIRTLDTIDQGFIKGTKAVLLLGLQAVQWLDCSITNLSQNRGYPIFRDGITFIPSYLPQDAVDMRGEYEEKHNPNYKEDNSREDGDEDGYDSKTTKGATKRSNYRFWLIQDIKKALRTPILPREIPITIYPNEVQIFDFMSRVKDKLFLDIENDKQFNLTCIGLGTLEEIIVVPIKKINNSLAYSEGFIYRFFAKLSDLMQKTTVVIHNSSYDLFVLAVRYHLAFGNKIYDTMLSHGRIYIGVEKSLGHCMSLLWEHYHKNEGVYDPKTSEEQYQLWEYNGKDIKGMIGVYEYQQTIINKNPDLFNSVKQVNDSIPVYLVSSIQGIYVDTNLVYNEIRLCEKRLTQLLRITKLITGRVILPTSSKQCVEYFHEELKLPVVSLSKKTKKPTLDSKSLLKLYLKYDHPFIPVILQYRAVVKVIGALDFNYWEQNLNHEPESITEMVKRLDNLQTGTINDPIFNQDCSIKAEDGDDD